MPKRMNYFSKRTSIFIARRKEGFQLAAQLYSEAIALDPAYAIAYSNKANALANLYRSYTRDPALLEEGLTLINEARRLKPDLWAAYYPLSIILLLQGKLAEAEAAAQEYIRNAPEDFMSHVALGFFYSDTGQDAKAIAPYEEALKRKPEHLGSLIQSRSCLQQCKGRGEAEALGIAIAIPLYEKRLKLFPDEEFNRVNSCRCSFIVPAGTTKREPPPESWKIFGMEVRYTIPPACNAC